MPKTKYLNVYETPPEVAELMAKLVQSSDHRILEPCAGTGHIAKAILDAQDDIEQELHLNEIDPERVAKLRQFRATNVIVYQSDFLGIEPCPLMDLVITNPPFDLAMEFIEQGLKYLNGFQSSRLLYLLPLDTFSSQKRSAKLRELNCYVAQIHAIPYRVDFWLNGKPMSQIQQVKNGVPQFYGKRPKMMSGRQGYDAVFCIKKGHGNFFSYLGE
jgi:hypothetical protein